MKSSLSSTGFDMFEGSDVVSGHATREASADCRDLQDGVGEPFDPFVCQICLDIAYKPVVLQACGHVFCFWCIRRSMNDAKPSLCPTCRQPFLHFPRVCRLLHFLLEKAWPLHYERKASETLAMEQSTAVFSPRILPLKTPGSAGDGQGEAASSSGGEGRKLHVYPERSELREGATVGVEDALCVACGRLLYRPVVINCGEAVCERCWEVAVANPECCGCGSVHAVVALHGRVCLALHHFLATAFDDPYSRRREAGDAPATTPGTCRVNPAALESPPAHLQNGGPPTSPDDDDDDDDGGLDVDNDDDVARFVHEGVGCDECGMFPMVSRKRYHCVECGELQAVGYDLCEACHHRHARGSDVCEGRFSQPHSPRLHHFIALEVSASRRTPSHSLRTHLLASALHLNLSRSSIFRRRRHAQQRILDDFDDYIDSLV